MIVHFDGNVREVKPILLSAHMDTVGLEVDDKPYRPTVKASIERQDDTMDLSYESPNVRLSNQRLPEWECMCRLWPPGGGCDADVFNKKGLEVANLSTGIREIHTVNEWLDLNDFYISARD